MTETAEEPVAAPRSKEEAHAEKAERFRRVAARRVNAALKQMELLRRTANEGSYAYTDEQTDKIVAALQGGVDAIATAYAGTKGTPKVEL